LNSRIAAIKHIAKQKKRRDMSVFSASENDEHERVVFVHDRSSGLRAIIAMHRVRYGLASGGIRMKPYLDEAAAISDALRLSKAMTNKFAMADLRAGGAKTVIIGDPARHKTPQLLHALGRAIDALGGTYVAGSDVGTSDRDMRVIQEVTPHVRGADPDNGDSSDATAYGVLQGLRAGARFTFGSDSLANLRVAVQGVGHVGAHLCALLHAASARLVVADVNADATAEMAARFGAEIASPEAILAADVDILAPCALGGVLTPAAAATIRARLVCGAANNQLADAAAGEALRARDIVFVPDYVVNAGGIVNGAFEGPDYDRARVLARLDRIYDRTLAVLREARNAGLTPQAAADRMAARLIAAADQVSAGVSAETAS